MDNEYLKRIYGLLESGATLGTGAVSGLVGLPYGLYKGVTSGAYGTPEAPRIAAREAQQFMERNTYQPRTAEGQANLQQLAGLLEATKLPPVMPEASLLAAIPKQAYAAQAERAGMAAEKAIAPTVARTMERGGLPAQLLGDLSQGSIRPMDVWHGSPHGPFPKFDSSKIGTGEGAQAYGHGIYTGEARGTGEEYRKALTGNQFGDKLVPTVDGIPSDTPTLRNLIRNGQSPEDFIASMQNKLKSQETALSKASKEELLPGISDYDMAEMALGETKKLIDEAKSYIGKEIKAEPIGYLYKVDLPDEAIANMLDWDKPLSKQPKNVQDYFYNHPKVQEYVDSQNAERLRLNEQYPGRLTNPALKNIVNKEMTADSLKGSKLYELATTGYSIQDEKIPVEMMRKAGIPGNRYLDQGSRNLESGTSNFVVFPGNEDLLKIKEINDKPYEQWFPKTNLLETAEQKAFDVTRRDASDIFGAGAERVKYTDPKSGGMMEVLAKPDGSASVISLEVPESSRGKGIGQSLQAQVMQDFPEMMGQVSSKAAAKTAYRLGRRPPNMPDATLDDVYKIMEENSSVNLVSPEMQKRFKSLLD